jgi:hypothetical protein
MKITVLGNVTSCSLVHKVLEEHKSWRWRQHVPQRLHNITFHRKLLCKRRLSTEFPPHIILSTEFPPHIILSTEFPLHITLSTEFPPHIIPWRLKYKEQLVNSAYQNSSRLFWESQDTLIYHRVRKMQTFWILKRTVHVVTTALKRLTKFDYKSVKAYKIIQKIQDFKYRKLYTITITNFEGTAIWTLGITQNI